MSNYEDEFPRYLGPPPVPNNTGQKLHDATKPTYILKIDSGAFMAMWEHMEAEAKHRFPTHSTYAHVRAYMRAVQAMRDCYWANHEAPDPPGTPARRRLVRRGQKN